MGQPLFDQIDVCIVSWRTRELLRACLRSVAGQPEVARVIVVDNASGDGTVEMVRGEFPEVRLIANAQNSGYAAGNNQAIRAGDAPLVLLLNPDTELRPARNGNDGHREGAKNEGQGALAPLLRVFREEPQVAAVAPQLILPDGRVERSCRSFPGPSAVLFDALGLSRAFPRSPTFGRYRMTYWDHASRRDVDQPMASALALRRAALDQVGLFDESFPLYFNDVDLCYRLRQAGWRIVFEPAAQVLHHHGQSTAQLKPQAVLESHRSLIRFYGKHYRVSPTLLLPYIGYWAVVVVAWLTMYPRAALVRLGGPSRPA